jgi:hypothetical protein
MTLPGLVAANNLSDVVDRERAWDNLGLSIAFPGMENFDTDAINYLFRVAIADRSLLEPGVAVAINSFVAGCKADGIWTAIKASCILAGARTLTGALVPLVGTAPTNFNFTSGDYNRKTGLIGDGSTKYLDSNRNNNTHPQNSMHISAYASVKAFRAGLNAGYIGTGGTGTSLFASGSSQTLVFGGINGGTVFDPINIIPGLIGVNRSSPTSLQCRGGGSTLTASIASTSPASLTISLFRQPEYSNARLAFYSIGESLDLALLDARVTDLINAFASAIP